MIDRGKHNILGVRIDAVDYECAVERIIAAAEVGRAMAVSALAVHGVMCGALDPAHRYRLNRFDMLVPDGQPVRWGLNRLHGAALPDRVYGPEMTLRVCAAAAERGLPIYFYGSRPEVLDALRRNLEQRMPGLRIAGMTPSRFQCVDAEEQQRICEQIRATGAAMVFVGLGCPRQEVWAFENAPMLDMPVIAVGAAFDFHAGLLRQAPPRMQRAGLEWFFRLMIEPRRLWRRYLYLNPAYVTLLALQALRVRRFDPDTAEPPAEPVRYA